MKKLTKIIFCFALAMLTIVCIACGSEMRKTAEKFTLAKTVLNEVEFENSDKVKLEQDGDEIKVTGEIEAMSSAQKSEYGVDNVTHVVVVKIMFDDEKTIDSFMIKGNVTKVYSTNKEDEFYVGSISSLLDNKDSEDAFCYLILSANTKEYNFVAKYSDGTVSNLNLKIEASLVTAKVDD